jgi:hypothetical protein
LEDDHDRATVAVGVVFMEVPERAMGSETVTTKQEAGGEGGRPPSERIQGDRYEVPHVGPFRN